MQLAIEGTVQLFISPTVLEEVREVAAIPRVIAKLRLVSQRVEEFIEAIEIVATLLQDFPEPFKYDRDPDDAQYVNLAIAAEAELLVSRTRICLI